MFKSVLTAAVAVVLFAAPISPSIYPAYGESTAKPQSDAQKAAAEHRKQCSKEWQNAKAAGKVKNGVMTETKQKWPQFNGACMKRLSGNA